MMPNTSCCIFTEGSAVLQEGYLDRSVKELLAGDERFPSSNVSRDALLLQVLSSYRAA
ncbi:hypothetical protein I5L04_22835 [Serratia marcescens]|nr:hypothetical protein [Serratia marcescens]NSM55386.1 hypothetical protein [Serratia marcescens]HAT3691029.1 DUF1795 domain-containing protein [Serratia marcescens]